MKEFSTRFRPSNEIIYRPQAHIIYFRHAETYTRDRNSLLTPWGITQVQRNASYVANLMQERMHEPLALRVEHASVPRATHSFVEFMREYDREIKRFEASDPSNKFANLEIEPTFTPELLESDFLSVYARSRKDNSDRLPEQYTSTEERQLGARYMAGYIQETYKNNGADITLEDAVQIWLNMSEVSPSEFSKFELPHLITPKMASEDLLRQEEELTQKYAKEKKVLYLVRYTQESPFLAAVEGHIGLDKMEGRDRPINHAESLIIARDFRNGEGQHNDRLYKNIVKFRSNVIKT